MLETRLQDRSSGIGWEERGRALVEQEFDERLQHARSLLASAPHHSAEQALGLRAIATDAPSGPRYLRATLLEAEALLIQGRLVEASPLLSLLKRAAAERVDQHLECEVVSYQAVFEIRSGNVDTGVALLWQALEQATHLNAKPLEAANLFRLSSMHYIRGDMNAALRFALRSVALYEALPVERGTVRALHSLALSYQALEELSSALEVYQQALVTSRQLGDRLGEAQALNNIGNIHVALQDDSSARSCFEQSLDLKLLLHDEASTAQTLSNLGAVLFRQGFHSEALETFARSLSLCRSLEVGAVVGINHCCIGDVYLAQGDVDAARDAFQHALDNARVAGSRPEICRAMVRLARLQFNAAQEAPSTPPSAGAALTQTLSMLEQALALARECLDREGTEDCLRALSDAHKLQGNAAQALAYFEAYHLSVVTAAKRAMQDKLMAHRIKFEVAQARHATELAHLRSVELARALEEVETQRQLAQALARSDSLTGLANRRSLEERLSDDFRRSNRYLRPLSVCLIDIDHFKRVNDGFSHDVGDEVLRRLAILVVEHIRAQDYFARYGGEEFVLVMPETPAVGALSLCERLRKMVEQYDWSVIAPGLAVTISGGICDDTSLPGHEKMLSVCDSRLYQAKRQGRNQMIGPELEQKSQRHQPLREATF